MSAPGSMRESRVEGPLTYYRGWTYASTCGHLMGAGWHLPARALCRKCSNWARANGTWDTHRGYTPEVDPKAVDLYRALRDGKRLSLYRKMMGGV